jgi:predicted nucleic acid-binding protein
MVAADSSTLIAHFQGDHGSDVEALQIALVASHIVLPPVVLAELLSEPRLPDQHRTTLLAFPLLDVLPDYWVRAAATRSAILKHGLRARLADTLIAQSCIDHHVALITRDRDFRHFAEHCGLMLA